MNTQSCGCYKTQETIARSTKHGQAKTLMYNRWRSILDRCTNANNPHFKNYGGRGISVGWPKFENFAADMGQPPFPGAQLDRIDNNGDYCPGNVKWSTRKQQMRNKRTNAVLEFNGQRHCIADWADVTGFSARNIWNRLRLGWSVERALTEPVRR